MVAHISNYSFTWSKGQKQWESQSASRLPPQPPLTQHCGRRRYTGRWGWPFRHLLRPLWSPLWRRKEPLDHPWSSRRKRSGHFALCWTAGGWFPHTPPAFQLLLLFQTWDHSRENIETVFCNVQLLRAWNSECETRKPIHPDFSYSSNARHDQQPSWRKNNCFLIPWHDITWSPRHRCILSSPCSRPLRAFPCTPFSVFRRLVDSFNYFDCFIADLIWSDLADCPNFYVCSRKHLILRLNAKEAPNPTFA